MTELTVLAPAKINLHLEVLGLRPDGFHELSMLMQSVDLCDRLRFRRREDGIVRLRCDLPALPVDGSNLIIRAAERLRPFGGSRAASLGAEIDLEKRIPIGAGLAGGSSDAAAALVGLNRLWNLDLSAARLQALAAELGSDVPFCLKGGRQLCFGRGDVLEPLPAGPPDTPAVLLIKDPGLSVSTAWAYGRCRETRGSSYLNAEEEFEQRRRVLRSSGLVAALAGEVPWPPLRNDLQSVVQEEVAGVGVGLQLLRRCAGSMAVAMSGSGPSLFALFPTLRETQMARSAHAEEMAAAGFEAWCCLCRSQGVSLEPASTAAA